MSTAQETVQGIVIDVCSKSFLLLSDHGNTKEVNCETTEEFMNVLEVVTVILTPNKSSMLTLQSMKKITVEELQTKFEEYLDKVEAGESFIISNKTGDVVMTPANVIEEVDDLIRIYTDHEEGC